ncbi:MAG: hypothetical protein WAX69_24370 [Victivallales bacterium]
MNFKTVIFMVALSACAVLPGCVTSPGGIAPSTVPITSKDTYTIIKTDASASDGAVVLFGIPLKTCSAYDALQTAKENYGADALINVTLENKSYWITILPIVVYSKISIRGDAIKFNRGKAD